MSLQDVLSDFVSRINNAVMADLKSTIVIKNRIVVNVCKKLTTLGYMNGFEDLGQTLLVNINLDKLNKITRVSKPGQRIYVSHDKIPRIIGGKGFNVISSSKGILTHVESKNTKLGGELLFQIY